MTQASIIAALNTLQNKIAAGMLISCISKADSPELRATWLHIAERYITEEREREARQ